MLWVVRVEIFTCPNCGGARRLLAAIQDPEAIAPVLRSVGLPFDASELAVARAPPDGGGGWLGAGSVRVMLVQGLRDQPAMPSKDGCPA